MTKELESARAAVSGAVELEAALAEQEAYAAHTRELAKRYPEVLEAHAQFGGEIPEMLRLYAYEGTRQELATLRSDNERLGRERDEARAENYVPGEFRCAKCGFGLSQFTFRASDGAIGSRDDPGEKCPNDGSPLWRVTWKERNSEHYERATEEMQRAQAAEAERDTLLAQVEKMRGVLTEIAESDDIDNALDPERNKRLARAALTKEPS